MMRTMLMLLIGYLITGGLTASAQDGRTYDSLTLALEAPSTAIALKLNGQAVDELDRIAELTELEVLQLRNCGLKEIPAGIEKLQKLKLLILSDNHIASLPDRIAELSSLEYLYLENNEVTEIPEALSKLPNLKALYLKGNRIAAVPDSLRRIGSLKLITLGGNPITAEARDRYRINRKLAGIMVTY